MIYAQGLNNLSKYIMVNTKTQKKLTKKYFQFAGISGPALCVCV